VTQDLVKRRKLAGMPEFLGITNVPNETIVQKKFLVVTIVEDTYI
jgi:hypothetical protein